MKNKRKNTLKKQIGNKLFSQEHCHKSNDSEGQTPLNSRRPYKQVYHHSHAINTSIKSFQNTESRRIQDKMKISERLSKQYR